MKECLFLFKDHSFTTVKKKFQKKLMQHVDDIKYILIPIDERETAYILHKPLSFMLHFHKAVISYESVVVQHSYIMDNFGQCYTPMHKITKEVSSIVELFQYLHSIDRLSFCNKLSSSNDSLNSEMIDFTYFNLELFDRNGKCFHKEKMDLTNQNGNFGPREILLKIKNVYNPINTFYKEDDILTIDSKSNTWDRINHLKMRYEECVVGINLPLTRSFSLLPSDIFQFMKSSIKSVYSYNLIYNRNVISDEEAEEKREEFENTGEKIVSSVRYNDMWTHVTYDWLEYLVYINDFYNNMTAIIEINDYMEITGEYIVKSVIQIETFDMEIKTLHSSSSEPITMLDIIQELV